MGLLYWMYWVYCRRDKWWGLQGRCCALASQLQLCQLLLLRQVLLRRHVLWQVLWVRQPVLWGFRRSAVLLWQQRWRRMRHADEMACAKARQPCTAATGSSAARLGLVRRPMLCWCMQLRCKRLVRGGRVRCSRMRRYSLRYMLLLLPCCWTGAWATSQGLPPLEADTRWQRRQRGVVLLHATLMLNRVAGRPVRRCMVHEGSRGAMRAGVTLVVMTVMTVPRRRSTGPLSQPGSEPLLHRQPLLQARQRACQPRHACRLRALSGRVAQRQRDAHAA